MALIRPAKMPLQRSFSEHVKDSTNKAWDVFWRSVRERRLWGECSCIQEVVHIFRLIELVLVEVMWSYLLKT